METHNPRSTQGTPGGAVQFRMLRIIHAAMCGGILLYLAISFYLVSTQEMSFIGSDDPLYLTLSFVSFGLLAACLAVSYILFVKKITSISNESLLFRFTEYRAASILRLAPIEGAAFFSLVCYFVTARWLFMAEALGLLGLMLYFSPTVSRIAEELKLNPEEVNWLQSN